MRWIKRILTRKRNRRMYVNSNHPLSGVRAGKGQKNPVVICNAVSLSEIKNGKFKAVAMGSFPKHKDGPHDVTRKHCEQMLDNINQQTLPVLIDYGHESIWNARAKAAGWADKKGAEVRDDGLYLPIPEWTSEAKNAIDNKEYQGLSAFYALYYEDAYGNIGARLLSVGLTNTPYMVNEVDHIPDFVANTKFFSSQFINSNNAEESNMFKPDQKAELIKRYELAENATDQQIADAIMADKPESVSAPADHAPAPALEPAPAGDAVTNSAVLKKLTETVNNVVTTVDKLVNAGKADQTGKINSLVQGAIDKKKILPAQKDVYINSAVADFEKTKTALDAIPDNAVLKGMSIDPGPGNQNAKSNSHAAAAAFLRARGCVPQKN